LRKFGSALLNNFGGLFSSNNLRPLIIGSAATGISAGFDDSVQSFFGEKRRAEALGEAGNVIGNPLVLGAVSGGTLLWSFNTENDRFRSLGFSLAQGYLVDWAMMAAMKAAIPRERPDGSNKNSFPSGHTSSTFMVAVVTSHYYRKATIPAYAIATLVGVSRLEKNRHYLSDVVAGATLGIIVGRTVLRGTDSLAKRNRITWMPVMPPGGGLAVRVSLFPDW